MKKIFIPLTCGLGLALSAPVQAQGPLPAYRPLVSPDVEFPSPNRATRPQGVFLPARHIVMVTPGLRKSQIYTLLDVPHFHEGLFGSRRWNYLLNFYTGNGSDYRQCQYQIRFNRRRVEDTYWRDAECAGLFEAALAAPEALVEPAREEAARPTRNYSFTFDFDRSQVNAQGHQVISEVVTEAVDGNYQRIIVTGYADRAGLQEYNDALAARRAAATAAELSARLRRAGSPLAQEVISRGGRELAVQTPNGVRERRNRRVLIELN